jgi:hypothetical protein
MSLMPTRRAKMELEPAAAPLLEKVSKLPSIESSTTGKGTTLLLSHWIIGVVAIIKPFT